MRAAGVTLYRSPNGVILARSVPPGGITAVQALTRRARAREPEFQRWFERPREGAETGSRAPARDP